MKAHLKHTNATLSKEAVEKLVSEAIKAKLQAELNSGSYEFDVTIEDKDVKDLPCLVQLVRNYKFLLGKVGELEKALAAKPAATQRFDAVKEGGAK